MGDAFCYVVVRVYFSVFVLFQGVGGLNARNQIKMLLII